MRRNTLTIEIGTPADIEAISTTREWHVLTPKQRTFVQILLTTGDAKQATIEAYPRVTTQASRRALQWQVLRAAAVANVLEVWKWRNSRQALISTVRSQLAASIPGSTAASTFAVQLERLLIGVPNSTKAHFKEPIAPSTEPEPVEPVAVQQTFVVGQHVTQRDDAGVDHVGVVRAVDASGLPIDIEEIL